MSRSETSISRRKFLRMTAAAGTAAGALMILAATAKGQGRIFKVGLIGCGGRGKGALAQNVAAGKTLGFNVQVVALADYFKDRAEAAGKPYGVPPERCFGGPASYRQLLETDAEIVLMATAPAFRPLHLEACVKAGKHAFIEKPVAVDPPGCRRVIEAGELAKKKGVVVVSGTEMRHDYAYVNSHQSVAVEKALGRLYGGRIGFCASHFFSRQAINPQTPEDLIRTWQSWVALSGDHLVEQHVHNIDIANWFVGHPPVSAVGFGGRARRPAGDQYDFFSVDFDYGDNIHIHSMCRQIAGCKNWVGHDFVYEKGNTNGKDGPAPRESPIPKDLPQGKSAADQEQIDVLYYVNKGRPLDQARAVAESSAAAVMGRISAYTGQEVFWDEIMADPRKKPEWYNLALRPSPEDFEKGTVEIPKEFAVAVPGKAV